MICKQCAMVLLVMLPKWRTPSGIYEPSRECVTKCSFSLQNHYMFPSSPFSRTLTWTEAANFSQVAALTKLW